MGKVLIALCTVFLLAFPARGEQAVTWESLTVWNDLPPLYDPAPWPSDLAGKRVILRWNGKHNGDLLLDYLHSLLSRAFPDTEFIKAYETDPTLSGISKDLPESEATARALLELRPDRGDRGLPGLFRMARHRSDPARTRGRPDPDHPDPAVPQDFSQRPPKSPHRPPALRRSAPPRRHHPRRKGPRQGRRGVPRHP